MKKYIIFILSLVFAIGCKKDSQLADNVQLKNQADKQMSVAGPVKKVYNLYDWMGSMGDQTKLTQLSIPGTHDAGARVEYVWSTAKCQDLSITDQLNIGVRFLDIRCRHIGNAFVIHHGQVYQKLNFQDVLNMCYDFLNRNPSETILMSIKEEYNAAANNRSFEQTLNAYINANPQKWNLDAYAGTIGRLRGKIKLIRRFGATTEKGIDTNPWLDNAIFDVSNSKTTLRIQDVYKVSNTNTKSTLVRNVLNEARYSSADQLYINFTSGYKSRWFFGIPDIRSVSDALNPMLYQYIMANGKGRYGIAAMDFINERYSRAIVSTNF